MSFEERLEGVVAQFQSVRPHSPLRPGSMKSGGSYKLKQVLGMEDRRQEVLEAERLLWKARCEVLRNNR